MKPPADFPALRRKLPRLLVVGSSNTDLVMECAELPAVGETVKGGVADKAQVARRSTKAGEAVTSPEG